MIKELDKFYHHSIKKSLYWILKKNNLKDLDICDIYDGRVGGVGYNELRFCWISKNGQLEFESNNMHDYKHGEDCHKVFRWKDLTDYEKSMFYLLLCLELQG